jgi:hypothetical protein
VPVAATATATKTTAVGIGEAKFVGMVGGARQVAVWVHT